MPTNTTCLRGIRYLLAMPAVVVLTIVATMGPAGAAGPPGASGDSRATSYQGNITSCPVATTQLLAAEGPTSTSTSGVTATAADPYLDVAATSALTGKSLAIYIVGGSNYNRYSLAVGSQGGSLNAMHAPYDGGGDIPSISHYLVCAQDSSANLPETGRFGIVGLAAVLAAVMVAGSAFWARRRSRAQTSLDGQS